MLSKEYRKVYNLKENKVMQITNKEILENNDIILFDHWVAFQNKYAIVIHSLIEVSSVFINPIADIPRAYNHYNDCFNSTASALYLRMREKVFSSSYGSFVNENWYFSLKTLTYHWLPISFDYNFDDISDTIIGDEFVPFSIWISFIAKQKFGRLIPSNIDEKETYRIAKIILLSYLNS